MNGKKRSISAVSVVLLAMFAFSLVPNVAEAKQIGGVVTIDPGGCYGWQMDVAIPSDIEFDIKVLNGTSVDVLVLNQENYTKYSQQDDFEFYEQFSALGTTNISANFTILSGTVFVIVDNTDRPQAAGASAANGSAEVQYWIASSFDLRAIPDGGTPWIAYILIAVIAPSLVAVVILTRRAYKQRRSALGRIGEE